MAEAETNTAEATKEMAKNRFQLQSRLGRSDRSPLSIWFWELDRVLLGLILALVAIRTDRGGRGVSSHGFAEKH